VRIRMLVDRTGTDNGITFPPRGGQIDVPDDVGAAMCAAGWAAPVAVPEPVETRAEPPTPAPEPAQDEPAEPAPAAEDPEPAQDEPEAHKLPHRSRAPRK